MPAKSRYEAVVDRRRSNASGKHLDTRSRRIRTRSAARSKSINEQRP